MKYKVFSLIIVLSLVFSVFGALLAAREEVKIRSHGSLYEREIPVYAYGHGPMSVLPKSNHEVAAWVT